MGLRDEGAVGLPAPAAPVSTQRPVLAHVAVCLGCCCGRTEHGRPPVPVDWLKQRWKARGLLRSVHLSISGCLGPCDVANVVSVLGEGQAVWLGGLTAQEEYEALADWAGDVAAAGAWLPLPAMLRARGFARFGPRDGLR